MQFVYSGIISWVLGKVLSPIISFVGKILEKVFTWAFDNVLEPILTEVLKTVVDWAVTELGIIFEKTLQDIEKMVEDILNNMIRLAGILVGAEPVSSNEKNMMLLEALMEEPDVKRLFWGVTVLAATLVGTLTFYAMLKTQTEVGTKRTAAGVARAMMQTYYTFLSGYAYVMVVILLSNALVSAFDRLIAIVMKTPGTGVFGVLSKVRDVVVTTYGSEYKFIGYVVSLGAGLLIMLSLMRTCLSLVRRVYDVVILFITHPFYAVTIIMDDGVTYRKYRNFFVARLLIGIGTYISLLLMTKMWIPFVDEAAIDSGDMLLDVLLKLLLIVGGIKSCEGVPAILGQVLGSDAAAVDERAHGKFDALVPFGLGKL